MNSEQLLARDSTVTGSYLLYAPDQSDGGALVVSDGWSRDRTTHLGAMLAPDLSNRPYGTSITYTQVTPQHYELQGENQSALLTRAELSKYTAGYFVLSLSFKLEGWHTPGSIVALANAAMMDDVSYSRARTSGLSPQEFAVQLASRALLLSPSRLRLLQKFTEIDVQAFSAGGGAHLSERPEEQQRDLLTLIIRRQSSFRDFRLDGLTKKYDNQSLYLDEYVCATPHNLFTQVSRGTGRIGRDFYAERYRRWRVLSAVLIRVDQDTQETMRNLSKWQRIRSLRRMANESGQRALEVELWRQAYDAIPQAVAARAKTFDDHVRAMLEIHELYHRIESRLELLEKVVVTRYSLSVQVLLQRISIALACLALLVSVIALFASSH